MDLSKGKWIRGTRPEEVGPLFCERRQCTKKGMVDGHCTKDYKLKLFRYKAIYCNFALINTLDGSGIFAFRLKIPVK